MLQQQLLQLRQLEGDGTSIANVISAYRKADPKIPPTEARKHILRLLDIPSGLMVGDDISVQIDKFASVLAGCSLPRYSPTESSRVSLVMKKKPTDMNHVELFLADYKPDGPPW